MIFLGNIIKMIADFMPEHLCVFITRRKLFYNTPRFSDRHNYGGMTRNRYICKKEENQNGKTI